MKIPETIAQRNRLKYLKPPEWNQIDEFLKELGINMYQFERFYKIPFNQLTHVKAGNKHLPAYAWHFVYEKIKPAYGIGFVEDYYKVDWENNKKMSLPKNLPKAAESSNHGRLTDVK